MSAPGCRFRPLALCFQQVPRVEASGYSAATASSAHFAVNRHSLNRFPPQEPPVTLQHPSRGDVSPSSHPHPMQSMASLQLAMTTKQAPRHSYTLSS